MYMNKLNIKVSFSFNTSFFAIIVSNIIFLFKHNYFIIILLLYYSSLNNFLNINYIYIIFNNDFIYK